MDSMRIGQYLAELRKYYNITQDELANRLAISRQAVSRWETGMVGVLVRRTGKRGGIQRGNAPLWHTDFACKV